MNEIEKKIKRANKTKTPELIQAHQKFTDVAGVSVPKVCKVLQKQCKITNDAVEAGKVVAESLEEFSVNIKMYSPEFNAIGKLLSQAAEFQSNLEDMRLKLTTVIDTEVVNPLAENVETFVNQKVKTERGKYKEARATWESSENALSAVRNNKKAQQPMIDKAKQDKEKAYDHLMNEAQPQFIKTLFEVSNTVECDLLERLVIFYESQQQFFKKTLENVEKILPEIKKQAEKKRVELEAMKTDMNRNYIVFGEELPVVLEREQSKVPSLVIKALGYLKNHVEEVGIFRLSGNKLKVDTLRKMVDDGKPTDFSTINESAVITSLLKLYLKMLPYPLMTWELYAHFTAIGSADEPEDITVMTSQLKELVDMLPPANKTLLQYMMQFLGTVAEKREKNKMDFANLGTVFAPTILYPKVETTDIESINAANKVIERLVKYYDLIFTDPLPDDIETYSNDIRTIDIFGEPPTNVNEISAVANLMNPHSDDAPTGSPLVRNSSMTKSRGEVSEAFNNNNNNNTESPVPQSNSQLSMSLQMPAESPQPQPTSKRGTFRHSLDITSQISSLGLDGGSKPATSVSSPQLKPAEEVVERRMTRSHTISSPSKFKKIKDDMETEVLARGETSPVTGSGTPLATSKTGNDSGEKGTEETSEPTSQKKDRKKLAVSTTLRLLGRKKKDKDKEVKEAEDVTASPARKDSNAFENISLDTPGTPSTPAQSSTPSTPTAVDSPSQKTREKSLMSFLTLRKGKKKDKDSKTDSRTDSRSEETTRDYSTSNSNDTPQETSEPSQPSQNPQTTTSLQEIPIEYAEADVSSVTTSEVIVVESRRRSGSTAELRLSSEIRPRSESLDLGRLRSESSASALSGVSEVSEDSNPDLLTVCPSCSAELQAWSKYCASCGWSKEKKETAPASTPSKSGKPVCTGFRPGKPKSICKRCGHYRDEHKKK